MQDRLSSSLTSLFSDQVNAQNPCSPFEQTPSNEINLVCQGFAVYLRQNRKRSLTFFIMQTKASYLSGPCLKPGASFIKQFVFAADLKWKEQRHHALMMLAKNTSFAFSMDCSASTTPFLCLHPSLSNSPSILPCLIWNLISVWLGR